MEKIIILIDLIGPLFSDGRKIAMKNPKKIGLPMKLLQKILYGKYMNLYKIGKISSNDYWNNIYCKNRITISKEKLKKRLYNLYSPNAKVFNLLHNLKKNNRILFCIFSNNIPDRIQFIKNKYKFSKYFFQEFYSYDFGLAKPNIQFYLEVKKKVESKNIIFIDDKTTNLTVGRKASFKCLRYTTNEKLIFDLRKILG